METLRKLLADYVSANLESYVTALKHFEKDEHFIYPIEQGGLVRNDSLRSKMDIFHDIGLVSTEDVDGWINKNSAKRIKVYELTKDGKKVFTELFGTEPKMCGSSHWSEAG